MLTQVITVILVRFVSRTIHFRSFVVQSEDDWLVRDESELTKKFLNHMLSFKVEQEAVNSADGEQQGVDSRRARQLLAA